MMKIDGGGWERRADDSLDTRIKGALWVNVQLKSSRLRTPWTWDLEKSRGRLKSAF